VPWDAAGVDNDILGQLSGFDSVHSKSDYKRKDTQNILGKKAEERSLLATFLELSLPDNFFSLSSYFFNQPSEYVEAKKRTFQECFSKTAESCSTMFSNYRFNV